MYLNYLNKITDGSISQLELNKLIEKCFQIARFYVRQNYFKISKFLDSHLVTIDDIAVDAIADIFSKNEKGEFNILINSIKNWNCPINSDAEATFFLNKIISNRVCQTIFGIIKESDPLFDYYLKHINYQISKHNYLKRNLFGIIYILEYDITKNFGRLIDEQSFENVPSNNFLNSKILLPSLFSYLHSEGFSKAIPLYILIKRLKHSNKHIYESDYQTSTEEDININELISKTVLKTNKKLEESYLKNNKLTPTEIESFKNIILDITEDMKDGGISGNLYDYFEKSMHNTNKTIYHLKYQNILEYLVKFLKKELQESLK